MDPNEMHKCSLVFVKLYKGTGITLFEAMEALVNLGFDREVVNESVLFTLRDQVWE